MLSSGLLETLDGVARTIRDRPDEAMGGMQVVAVGDFGQLPPVVTDRDAFAGDGLDEPYHPFCFDSPVWDELDLRRGTHELSVVQRQQAGSAFERFLSMVRDGSVTPDIVAQYDEFSAKIKQKWETSDEDGHAYDIDRAAEEQKLEEEAMAA